MGYKVTVSVDSLDPKPDIHYFDDGDSATEFIYDTVSASVQWRVEHSPYTISEEELENIREEEMTLVRLEKM